VSKIWAAGITAKRKKDRAVVGFEQAWQGEGRSLWELEVYAAADIPDIVNRAQAGDEGCRILARIIVQISDRLSDPDMAGSLPHCVLCTQMFTSDGEVPAMFGIMRSAVRRGPMLAHLICEPCSKQPDLRAGLFEAVRRDIMSDVTEVHLAQPGHA